MLKRFIAIFLMFYMLIGLNPFSKFSTSGNVVSAAAAFSTPTNVDFVAYKDTNEKNEYKNADSNIVITPEDSAAKFPEGFDWAQQISGYHGTPINPHIIDYTEKEKTYTAKPAALDYSKIVSGTITRGVYCIKPSANTNFDLSVEGASTKNGARVILWTASNTKANHYFRFTPAGDGTFTLTAKHSDRPLYSSSKKGHSLIQSSVGSKFYFIPLRDGTYRIKDKKTGFYLGVSEAKMINGNAIISWTKATDRSQTYIIVEQ